MPVADVLRYLAEDYTVDELVQDYPTLSREVVQEFLEFMADTIESAAVHA